MSTKPFVAVLDYGIGNLRSAEKALARQGARAELTANPQKVLEADAVVLPGVGHFGTCLSALRERGLEEVVLSVVKAEMPFLGICVGMQMLYEGSDEAPGVDGLKILSGRVELLSDSVRRPQMQWNTIRVLEGGAEMALLEGLDGVWMYFVHSYSPQMNDSVAAVCEYGGKVPAVVKNGKVVATQFHPEKSGRAGLKLLANFVNSL